MRRSIENAETVGLFPQAGYTPLNASHFARGWNKAVAVRARWAAHPVNRATSHTAIAWPAAPAQQSVTPISSGIPALVSPAVQALINPATALPTPPATSTSSGVSALTSPAVRALINPATTLPTPPMTSTPGVYSYSLLSGGTATPPATPPTPWNSPSAALRLSDPFSAGYVDITSPTDPFRGRSDRERDLQ